MTIYVVYNKVAALQVFYLKSHNTIPVILLSDNVQ